MRTILDGYQDFGLDFDYLHASLKAVDSAQTNTLHDEQKKK